MLEWLLAFKRFLLFYVKRSLKWDEFFLTNIFLQYCHHYHHTLNCDSFLYCKLYNFIAFWINVMMTKLCSKYTHYHRRSFNC